MIATGQIQIDQPGLRATGGRLVYTAADGLFVLTGDGKTLPRLVDSARGTITGAALLFHAGDDSVEVTSVEPGGAAEGQGCGPRHTRAKMRRWGREDREYDAYA